VVGLINRHGPFAVGMSGRTPTCSPPAAGGGGGRRVVDIGLVGDIDAVNPAALQVLLADGRCRSSPASPAARSGEIYNVNADTAAAALAVALGASQAGRPHRRGRPVPGLARGRRRPRAGHVISQLSATELERLLPSLAPA
jgi:acetylglutamate kinase